MNKEVDLSVSCYGKVKDLSYDLVVLPWGATEPHNLRQKVSEDTGIGCPKLATAKKGKHNAEAAASKYAKLFMELVTQEMYS